MPTKHPNPLFRRTSQPRRVSPLLDLAILGGILAAALVVAIVPPFRLTTIEVEGANRLNPAFVAERAQRLLAQRVAFILPQSSYFLAREEALSKALLNDLRQILPMTSVVADKRFPRTLRIIVDEAEPAAILVTSDGEEHYLDERGVVASVVGGSSAEIPKLEEMNGLTFAPGDPAVAPAVVGALREVDSAFRQQAHTVTRLRTATVACLFDLRLEPPAPRAREINTNEALDEEGRGKVNGSTTPTNANRATNTTPTAIACDRRAELIRTTVFSVDTESGWSATFDAKRGITESLTMLWTVLSQKLTGPGSFKEIDLRFLPRVYYR